MVAVPFLWSPDARGIARIVGPASIGLLLLFVSEVQLFALNGATFAVSAVALRRLAGSPRGAFVADGVMATGTPLGALPAASRLRRRDAARPAFSTAGR
ncbi:hypothetical protein [Streptomyces sp. NPDC090021]|uniref:hypothetical protein n=1 Tax=Streptomyces sp. NPDC090021 TaxID=3365919 RepID=UPI00382D6CF8